MSTVLLSEEERAVARRRVWRESQQRRRDRLKQGQATAPSRRRVPGPTGEMHQWWLDNYSLDEILELGSGLLLFAVDDEEVAA